VSFVGRPIRTALVALLAVVIASAGPDVARAHARLTASEPAGGSSVTLPPQEVVLRFSEPVEADFAQSQVVGPDGARVDNGPPTVSGSELRQPLLALRTPGAYSVAFRVVSSDGHAVEGTLGFEYAPAPPSTPDLPSAGATVAPTEAAPAPTDATPLAVGTASSERGRAPAVPGVLIAAVAVVLLAGLAFALTRPRRRPPSP
jgi:methionine-rich copper-binding protein CopC